MAASSTSSLADVIIDLKGLSLVSVEFSRNEMQPVGTRPEQSLAETHRPKTIIFLRPILLSPITLNELGRFEEYFSRSMFFNEIESSSCRG